MSGGPLLLAVIIRQLHSPRYFRQGGNHAEAECVECEQVWPCATEQAIRQWEQIPEARTATVQAHRPLYGGQKYCYEQQAHHAHDWTDPELPDRTWRCTGIEP